MNDYRSFYLTLLAMMAVGIVAGPSSIAQAPDVSATFTVTNGAYPWSDRVSVWQLADVPASVAGNGPLQQQSCSSRMLTIPDGTKYVLVGVSNNDLDKFKALYPDATPTGDSISVVHADGSNSIPYTIFKKTSPPASMGDPSLGAGLLLLQINDKPAAASAPAAAHPTPSPAPSAPATK
jgi:hypothetical protein